MTGWTKDTALRQLAHLTQECDKLTGSYRKSPEHTRWYVNTQQFLSEVFGRNSIHYAGFSLLSWQPTGSFFLEGWDVQGSLDARFHRAYLEDLGTAKGLLQAAYDELSTKELREVYHGKDTPPESSGIFKVLGIVERKLRKVIRESPEKERVIQDALEDLFIGAELSYSRETEHIEYSSKAYIPDFTMTRLDLAIEVKLCSHKDREKQLITEINDDILAYKKKYGNVIFVVYDCGFIRDTEKFAQQLEESSGVLVRVVKH